VVISDLIENNVKSIQERIARAAEKADRGAEDILLVAISKMQPLEKIYQAHQAGIKNFGENKIQDLIIKISESTIDVKWHMVGHLQSNKINKVIGNVEMIQSVDSIHLLEKLDHKGLEKGISSKVLLQVNTSGEDSKFGFETEDVFAACEMAENLSAIEIQGLMTIGPFTSDESRIAKS
jgi:pyridoxal phosphate enzyme (YggS family)